MQKTTLFIVSFLSFSLSASYETDLDEYARHYRIELPSSSNGTDAESFDAENAENDIFLNGSDHDRSSNGIDAECLDPEIECLDPEIECRDIEDEENYDTFSNESNHESDDESNLYPDFSPETIFALENAYEKFDRLAKNKKRYASSRHIIEHLSKHRPTYTASKTTQKSRKEVDLFSKSYDSPDLVGEYPLGKKTDLCTTSFSSKEKSKPIPHFSGSAKSDAPFTPHYETLFLQVALLAKK